MVDLNRDGWIDLATVRGDNRVGIQLQKKGNFQRPTILGNVGDRQGIAAGDVNGDWLPDLYVVAGNGSEGTDFPDLMLLNQGAGSFRAVPVPHYPSGSGQRVASIDYNRDGIAEFLVLNGRTRPGPVRMLGFRPH